MAAGQQLQLQRRVETSLPLRARSLFAQARSPPSTDRQRHNNEKEREFVAREAHFPSDEHKQSRSNREKVLMLIVGLMIMLLL